MKSKIISIAAIIIIAIFLFAATRENKKMGTGIVIIAVLLIGIIAFILSAKSVYAFSPI